MRSNVNERLAHIATPFGKTMQPITELRAGDIGVSRETEGYAHRRHALRERRIALCSTAVNFLSPLLLMPFPLRPATMKIA